MKVGRQSKGSSFQVIKSFRNQTAWLKLWLICSQQKMKISGDSSAGEKEIVLKNCKLKKKHELSVPPDSFHISEDLRSVKQAEDR